MSLKDQAKEFLEAATGQGFDEGHTRATPERFAKMLVDLTTPEPFTFTTFENDTKVDEMVVLGAIPFYTLCAHHVIPFMGEAHIAYIPGEKIAGLSKFARAVRSISRGLHVQETLTTQIADFLEEQLQPQGLAVLMQAEHLCMAMRGAQMPGVVTTTSSMRGVFADHDRTAKSEFMSIIRMR